MPARLRNLVITRVDLVDKGANEGAHVVLTKRDVRKDGPALGAVNVNKPVGDEKRKHRDDRAAHDRENGQPTHSREFMGTRANPGHDEDEGGAQAASSIEYEDEYGTDKDGELLKGTLSSGERNALPDSAFAAVWTDKDGKKQRKFPFKRKDGSVDLPHLRNALARMEQNPSVPADVKSKAKAKLEAAAKANKVGERNKRMTMKRNLMKRLLAFIAKEAEAEADADAEAMGEAEGGDGKLPDAHQKYLKRLHGHLGKMIKDAAGADGGHDHLPADHPIHKVKETHEAIGKLLAAYGEQPGEIGESEWEEAGPDEGGPDPYGREPGDRNAATKEARFSKKLTDLEKRAVAAEKRAAEAEKIAKDEREARAIELTKATLQKFHGVSVDVDKDAQTFRKLETESPAEYKRVMELLGAADEAVAKSALYQEFGSPRGGDGNGGTAWGRIEAEAAKLVEKDTKMTKAKAIDLVMKRRTDLVREHEAEQRALRVQ